MYLPLFLSAKDIYTNFINPCVYSYIDESSIEYPRFVTFFLYAGIIKYEMKKKTLCM